MSWQLNWVVRAITLHARLIVIHSWNSTQLKLTRTDQSFASRRVPNGLRIFFKCFSRNSRFATNGTTDRQNWLLDRCPSYWRNGRQTTDTQSSMLHAAVEQTDTAAELRRSCTTENKTTKRTRKSYDIRLKIALYAFSNNCVPLIDENGNDFRFDVTQARQRQNCQPDCWQLPARQISYWRLHTVRTDSPNERTRISPGVITCNHSMGEPSVIRLWFLFQTSVRSVELFSAATVEFCKWLQLNRLWTSKLPNSGCTVSIKFNFDLKSMNGFDSDRIG
jgi:hypothetical protein